MSDVASPVQVNKICILGAGQFGFALTKYLSSKHTLPIVLYDPVKELVDAIQQTRRHATFFPGITLGDNCSATHSMGDAIDGAGLIILSVPGQFMRNCIKDVKGHVKQPVILLNVAKALEPKTGKMLHEVIDEEMRGSAHPYYFGCLAGGMLADEVTQGMPIAADVACENEGVANLLSAIFNSSEFKVAPLKDVIGVELAGALKNVIAIGAGFFDGLKYAASSKAAYISQAAHEMRALAIALGADHDTFDLGTQAWLGDVLTTCYGDGRNRLFGDLIGSGQSVEEALAFLDSRRKRAEGYLTAQEFLVVAKSRGLKTPVLAALVKVLFRGGDVRECVRSFFETPSAL